MTALAYTDVTITVSSRNRDFGAAGIPKNMTVADLAFGDGSLTYPSGGVPIGSSAANALARLGFVKDLDIGLIEDAPANGYVYKFDRANRKVRIWQSAGFTPAGTVAAPTFTGSALGTHVHDMKVIGGITEDEPVGLLSSGPTLGKLAATDRTIAGADSATKGGVVAITAGTPAGSNSAPAFSGTAVAAGVMVELGAVAVAATTLRMLFIGE